MFRLDSHLSVSRAPRPCDLLNSERDGGGHVRGRGALHTITAGSGRKIVIQLTGDTAWNNRRREKTSVSAVGSRRELFVHRDGRSRQHPPEMTTSNQPAALHCGLWHSNRYRPYDSDPLVMWIKTCGVNDIADAVATRKDIFIKR